MAQQATGPLAGVKVVELAHIMAGPVCGLMLADLGADVIKVEKIPAGDDTRRMVPPKLGDQSAAFMMMNRNKRGIAVDLKRPEGQEILKRLLRDADVLIENHRRGTMDRLGLGYEALSRDNPGLVYCSVSGFGRTGPYADRGGFDLIAQGMSGLMSITGEGPGRPPVKVGAPVTDITAGILAAMGVLAAYTNRLKTGRGQIVDTSLFEAGIVHTYWQSAICLATGISPGAMGSAHPLNAPYQAYPTADGWLNLGAANQNNWEKLCDAIDAGELKTDPRFAQNAGRMANMVELNTILDAKFRARSTADWLAILERAGVPAGPVLSIAEMHADAQAQAREMVPTVTHSTLGEVKTIGVPVKFTGTPAGVRRGAPLLGEHTREVLQSLGYAAAEIESLLRSGAVAAPAPTGQPATAAR
jgi:crotonobetainyl-CoA:carnitine CoA-transferase CaiB-like acyl-CoA transferase